MTPHDLIAVEMIIEICKAGTLASLPKHWFILKYAKAGTLASLPKHWFILRIALSTYPPALEG
jgi:hypothetical protein